MLIPIDHFPAATRGPRAQDDAAPSGGGFGDFMSASQPSEAPAAASTMAPARDGLRRDAADALPETDAPPEDTPAVGPGHAVGAPTPPGLERTAGGADPGWPGPQAQPHGGFAGVHAHGGAPASDVAPRAESAGQGRPVPAASDGPQRADVPPVPNLSAPQGGPVTPAGSDAPNAAVDEATHVHPPAASRVPSAAIPAHAGPDAPMANVAALSATPPTIDPPRPVKAARYDLPRASSHRTDLQAIRASAGAPPTDQPGRAAVASAGMPWFSGQRIDLLGPLVPGYAATEAPTPLTPLIPAEPGQALEMGLGAFRADPAAPAQPVVSVTVPSPPPSLQGQLALAARNLGDGPVEITLSPAELGRVTLTLSGSDGGLVVTVLAERSETLDLLRRSIGQLAAELRSLGYENPGFAFHQGQRDPERSQVVPPAGRSASVDAVADTAPASKTTTGRLDLRL